MSHENWSSEDIRILRLLYDDTPIHKLSILLRRTEKSIACLASRLNLKKKLIPPTPKMSEERQAEWLDKIHGSSSGWPRPNTDWTLALKGRWFSDVQLKKGPKVLFRPNRTQVDNGISQTSLASSYSINKRH